MQNFSNFTKMFPFTCSIEEEKSQSSYRVFIFLEECFMQLFIPNITTRLTSVYGFRLFACLSFQAHVLLNILQMIWNLCMLFKSHIQVLIIYILLFKSCFQFKMLEKDLIVWIQGYSEIFQNVIIKRQAISNL